MRQENKLKARLAEGETVLGTWCVLPSPSVINVIAAAGLDFVIIDMEHGPHTFETAEDMVRAAESEECTPLIRVPSNEDWLILRGLEIGSHGVMVPQITTPQDAAAAMAALKYHPEGKRGVSVYTRTVGYDASGDSTSAARENAGTLSVLLVESVEGIDNLDAILDTPEIDVVYIGTYDLSQSVGHPGQVEHPEVIAFVEDCVKRIRRRGIAAGCLAQSQADIERWRDIGIQFIPYQADCSLLYNACLEVRSVFSG